MNSLISVIVPVFKVEAFLVRCVESILNQTYRNIEIILIDDGSPDECPKICDDYAKKDKRIRVLHKKNGGLSDARNAGINVANGEYICFVDSDDYIQPTMIEHLFDSARKTQAKMVIVNFQAVDSEGYRLFPLSDSPICDGFFDAKEIMPKIYAPGGWYYIVAWNKLYHRSLFDRIKFPVGKIHEDEYVVIQLMWEAQTIACISTEEYNYRFQRVGGITNSQQSKSHCDWLNALWLRYLFLEEKHCHELSRTTREVYFRELTNLFLEPKKKKAATLEQRKVAMEHYDAMKGKSFTEKINWFVFQISPVLDKKMVELVRAIRDM